jgi:hypothetical protein
VTVTCVLLGLECDGDGSVRWTFGQRYVHIDVSKYVT